MEDRVHGHHTKGEPYRYKHGWIPITPRITAAEARGNSRAVSAEEFDKLVTEGNKRMDEMSKHHTPILPGGAWNSIVKRTFAEVQQSWGGATIDAHTGEELNPHADKYALSVKPGGISSISIPENAPRHDLRDAMMQARRQFSDLLERDNYYLGVFHDDANHRIDLDPVVVVDNVHDVEAIGAATHAIGGAYHFSDGNGYFPPHVTQASPRSMRPAAVHWKGPGEWRSAAVKLQYEHRASENGHHVPGTPYHYKHDWIPIGFIPGKEGSLASRLDVPRQSMDGIAPNDPLRGKIDAQLASEKRFTRDIYKKSKNGPVLIHRKGDLKRPSVSGGYDAAVQRYADHLSERIKARKTLAEGRTWYPDEHKRAVERAKAYGVSVAQAVAVESATSPRCGYQTNQRVTQEILDAGPKLKGKGLHALVVVGGGVMPKFRAEGMQIVTGQSIDKTLGGAKRRPFFNNIMYPGKTQDVTVDTWMIAALGHALNMNGEQAVALGDESAPKFPDGIGKSIAADATRKLAKQMGESPDAVQAAYWIAAQIDAGIPVPGHPTGGVGGKVGGKKGKKAVLAGARSMPDTQPEGSVDTWPDDEYDAELIIDYLTWLQKDIPGRIDLGPPTSGRADDSLAANNAAAWDVVQGDPRFKALGLSLSRAQELARTGTKMQKRASVNGHHVPGTPTHYKHGWIPIGVGSAGKMKIKGNLPDNWSEDWSPPRPDGWTPDLHPAAGVKNLISRGRKKGLGTAEDPIDVKGNLDEALRLMSEGKHVRLNQVDEVSLLLDKIKKISEATANDNPKPHWDFGLLTVRGTNLFTAQHRGIPRLNMPQFSGVAEPNTPAATKAGGAGKFVDLTSDFAAQLRKDGIQMRSGKVAVSHLRATQTELNGGKVAGFVAAAQAGNQKALSALAEPIYVTRDHYVIDGHHRWAANMMLDALDGKLGNNTYQNVIQINMDIGAAIPYANQFAQQMGIAGRAARSYAARGSITSTSTWPSPLRWSVFFADSPMAAEPAPLDDDDRATLIYLERRGAGTLVHEPVIGGKGKGLWSHPGWQLPAYIQHVANDLIQSGHLKSRAISMAIGIIKNWAHGHDGKGHRISATTQAKAVAALAEWTRLKLQAKLHHLKH